jgi:predicted  nucleic acid-binding Zn-ribbon protein
MADEKHTQGEGSSEDKKKKKESDSGLGNLPPLSDFDSESKTPSDSGLPPLGSFDSGGLPPISDIDVETPQPTGGAIKPAPSGFGASSLDTPAKGTPAGGFQDAAADSDFSPETPEIGPGPSPESNMDTPLFDSAFGGGDLDFGSPMETPAPTQAMETPMFGEGQAPAQQGQGFDAGAFGAGMDQPGSGGDFGGMDFGGGTPPPDFTADTGMPAAAAPIGGKPAKKGGSPLLVLILVLLALGGGIVAGPYLVEYLPLPNPMAGQISELETSIRQKDGEIARLEGLIDRGVEGVDRAEVEKIMQQLDQTSRELEEKSGQLQTVESTLQDRQAALSAIEEDVAQKNEEFVRAQEMFEDLENETAIVQARQRGLIAEVDRLTGYVGELEVANRQRVATKEALEHNIDRLIIQIKEGMPLTPQKFAHGDRLRRATELREAVARENSVTPALQNAYTELYLTELQIAASQEYFFAKIPVTDKYQSRVNKWAECLMQGNWAVYYRTLDGKNIGVYENISSTESPMWTFRESLPTPAQKEIEARIFASRADDWAEKVQVLAEKELDLQENTAFQVTFDSL